MSEREPITAELRELMGGVEPRVDEDGVVTAKYVTPEAWGEFDRICDAIDAVHAGLERENAELRQRVAELDKRGESMHDGRRITDELREYANTRISPNKGMLTAIADRIDAEHEKAIAATLWSGMLTADDVRDLIERHSDASGGNGRDFHNGAYVAIADELNATIGSCNCSNNCTNSERADVPRLPHFWTHDGTLHIEATRMPTRIVVCEGGTCEFVPKRELDASEAENAKLREQVDAAHMSRLLTENENAKLRELCKDLWRDIPKSNCEWDMDANLCTGYDKCHGECGLWMRLRELGVEVDE